MASFNVSITVPDDKLVELREALRSHFSPGNINGADMTNAELKAAFDAEVRRMLANIYKRYKERQASVPDLEESA